jgi:hypothetical protein
MMDAYYLDVQRVQGATGHSSAERDDARKSQTMHLTICMMIYIKPVLRVGDERCAVGGPSEKE